MRSSTFPKILLSIVLAGLAACAQVAPPPTPGCELPAYRLAVSKDGLGPKRRRTVDWSDRSALRTMMKNELLKGTNQRKSLGEEVLIFSGGSQHGAFGAGFFAGMGKTPDGVPAYAFITAVSTGALASTLVFLANDPVEKDRIYPSYMTDTGVSNLQDLAALFSVDDENRVIHVRPGGGLQGITTGSLATFDPLRSLIAGILSDRTLDDLQKAIAIDHRHLLVGVTNLNDGNGYAVDLTQYVDTALNRGTDRKTIRACYIDVLLASSSVPPAMAPISLTLFDAANPRLSPQTAMYIDGGARFGVFWEQLQLSDLPHLQRATMVVNGKLSAGLWDNFVQTQKWSILSLARRSTDILINQVYRFSVDQIEHQFTTPKRLNEAYISNAGLEQYEPAAAVAPDDFSYTVGGVTRTCGEWEKYDDDQVHPLEFHPHYMQCLVAYGEMRGKRAPWNRIQAR